MDMETSYVIVVYSNHLSFATSAQAAISHPTILKYSRDSRDDGGDGDADTSPDVSLEMRDHKHGGQCSGHIKLTTSQSDRGYMYSL